MSLTLATTFINSASTSISASTSGYMRILIFSWIAYIYVGSVLMHL